MKNYYLLSLVSLLAWGVSTQAKVYKNIKVGDYEARLELSDCLGTTFLNCMQTKVYPLMKQEAPKRTRGEHIDGVTSGEGVELRLTEDVSTYHVKYKAAGEEEAERSGRSFAGVGAQSRSGTIPYVADASDAYYLDSLQKISADPKQLKAFYEAIFKVVVNSDAVGFSALEEKPKQVAADFVAVLVAEQYRHLVGGDGKLGRSFNWDDALLQVTMLASFHAGQSSNFSMFYEGEFTDQVFDQRYDVKENGANVSYCLYQKPRNRDELKQYYANRKKFEDQKRQAVLRDYWQFNKKCKRSGINMTRKDFSKMGEAITSWVVDSNSKNTQSLLKLLGDDEEENLYSAIAKFFINNDQEASLKKSADKLVNSMVALLMEVHIKADEISQQLRTE